MADDRNSQEFSSNSASDPLLRQSVKERVPGVSRRSLLAAAGLIGFSSLTVGQIDQETPPRSSILGALTPSIMSSQSNDESPSNEYYGDPDNWVSSGDGTHDVTDSGVFDHGVDLTWDKGGTGSGSWEFSVTAQESTELEFEWDAHGCHSWHDSDAKGYVFSDDPSGEIEEQLFDTGGCSWSRSGTDTIELFEGREFGIRITGYHFDGTERMDGRFSINFPLFPSMIEIDASGNVTISNVTISGSD